MCTFCFPVGLAAGSGGSWRYASQERALVKGIILDKVTRAPIPYAYITVNRDRAYQADARGAFSLWLQPEDRLLVKSLGYAPRELRVGGLLRQASAGGVEIFLESKHQSLQTVEVKAKPQRWKARKVSYHIDEGSTFHHTFTPSEKLPDTLDLKAAGQEIGNRIRLRGRPGVVHSVSFGLAGSGNAAVMVGTKLYSIKDDMPDRSLLPQPVIIPIEPHRTGWITVDLARHNITVEEDFALVVEWLSKTTLLHSGTLMAFATLPKGQVTYYRAVASEPWRILDSALLDVKSIGMYATLLSER